MKKMKAMVHYHYGPPEVVKLVELPKPTPKNNEICIQIKASTVNRTDCGFRSAEYFISRFFSGLIRPKQPILGCEFAGVVTEIGSNVSKFKIGDAVFGFNDTIFGGHAEFRCCPETDNVAKIPDGFSFEEAAAFTEGAHYALCDIRAAKIKAGDRVLVYGATGAIGSAAVQLLRYFGAEVWAVCATPNLELIRNLGAVEVIDYTKTDFTKVNTTFDLVFDAVGKSSFGQSKPILKPNGIYISTELGKNLENIWLAMLTPIFRKKKVLFPLPSINPEMVEFLGELAKNGHFRPIIDRKYELSQMVEAYRYVETGQKIGNVVVKMPNN